MVFNTDFNNEGLYYYCEFSLLTEVKKDTKKENQ